MGSCGSCCGKREGEGTSLEKSVIKTNPGGITSQEIPNLIQFISKYFSQFPQNDLIVLNLPKDQLKNFVAQLNKIISIIKEKTNKIMVPISIQPSVINSNTDMIILMRTITNIQEIFFLDQSLPSDISILSQKFTVRAFQFMSREVEQRKIQLSFELDNYYKTENLLFIGGVQDKNKANSLQMLFYKRDKVPTDQPNGQLNLSILTEESNKEKLHYEEILNTAQLSDNNVLRVVLSFEDAISKVHFLILQQQEGDKLYLVNQFASYLHTYIAQFLSAKATSKGFDEQAAKEEMLQKISDYLHQQDQNLKNNVQTLIVNSSLTDTLIICVK